MKVSTVKEYDVKVSVGDIIKFKHAGTAKETPFYLLCYESNADRYFIINLSGKKSKLTYYSYLSTLLNKHESNIEAVYPASEYQIVLEKMMKGTE